MSYVCFFCWSNFVCKNMHIYVYFIDLILICCGGVHWWITWLADQHCNWWFWRAVQFNWRLFPGFFSTLPVQCLGHFLLNALSRRIHCMRSSIGLFPRDEGQTMFGKREMICETIFLSQKTSVRIPPINCTSIHIHIL